MIKVETDNSNWKAPKVRKKRKPMSEEQRAAAAKRLEKAREKRLLNPGDTCLFPSRNGTRMSRVGFWAMIKKHALRAGITSRINPRILRHSFAVHLLQNGIDLSDIFSTDHKNRQNSIYLYRNYQRSYYSYYLIVVINGFVSSGISVINIHL